MPSEEAGATAEEVAADLVGAAEAVDSAAVVAAVHFVGAVEAVRFAEGVAAFEVAVDLAEASAEDTAVAMVAGMATGAVIGAATDSSLALVTPLGIGRVMPTILTIMDTPPIMVIRVIPDTIRMLTADMAPTDHMLLIRSRLL